MKLGTTYICVDDMEKSFKFYKLLLQKEPLYCNDDRWIAFDCGNQIALYNKKYDENLLKNSSEIHFNQAYIDDFHKEDGCKKNNIVIFNFEVENLKREYERIKALNIGEVSEIMYVNVHMPYYYFNVIDPDGNILEITGNY
ncbi:VOC family protein [Thomasclavelia cocleata]|jgi:predicted enzyme related to lactoylglutathione lyase|uniref:VOC family protein n=1 Tax=Thomasclavelia cocleata TaxID=69824 RepID=UPI00272E7155|nr:VOC family protein [Thomasclavelia cocleata]